MWQYERAKNLEMLLKQLEERKLAIVRLLSAEVMTPVEVVCPLIMDCAYKLIVVASNNETWYTDVCTMMSVH